VPRSTPSAHPNARLVERFYAVQRRFYAGENVVADLRGLVADDVVWHVPGRSAIAGEYRGLEQVLAYFTVRREIADNTFRITSRGVLADANRVVHFADGEALISGELRRWRTVGIFNISDGLIAECWLLPFDQYQFDEIWGGR
jgi:ketosteroid isomerase-like protein